MLERGTNKVFELCVVSVLGGKTIVGFYNDVVVKVIFGYDRASG